MGLGYRSDGVSRATLLAMDEARAQDASSDVRIVQNRLLGGWFIVRGSSDTPISGRFSSKEEAQQSLIDAKNKRDGNFAKDAADPRDHAQKLIRAYGFEDAMKMANANLGSPEGRWWSQVADWVKKIWAHADYPQGKAP